MKIAHTISKFFLLLICFYACAHADIINHNPIYHPNGCIAWTGNEYSPFYHDNYSIAWEGLQNPHSLFSYKSGQKVWDGFLYKECGYDSSYASVYHLNGTIAWKGTSRNDCYYSYDSCSVFHDNGQKAWGGNLYQDCRFLTTHCIVYHNNGNVAWNGAMWEELYYANSGSNFYHINGSLAWGGAFAKNGADIQSCGVFYDNGQLAWGGKTTDPIYDMNGIVITGRSDSIQLSLGDSSLLQVHANGTMFLYLSLGNDRVLKFSNLSEHTELWMLMGPGIRLIFSPISGNFARFQVYDNMFVIN